MCRAIHKANACSIWTLSYSVVLPLFLFSLSQEIQYHNKHLTLGIWGMPHDDFVAFVQSTEETSHKTLAWWWWSYMFLDPLQIPDDFADFLILSIDLLFIGYLLCAELSSRDLEYRWTKWKTKQNICPHGNYITEVYIHHERQAYNLRQSWVSSGNWGNLQDSTII